MQSAHSYKLSCTSRLLASLALSLAVLSSATAAAESVVPAAAAATAQTPDAFIKTITAEVFATVKADKAIQSGDIRKVIQVVDTKIMPNVNFQRMTASAVGRGWRQATPEQQKRLQDEFKTLLVYTYAGAVSQIKDQTIEYKPMRNRPEDTDVVVRTVVRGKGDPVQLDYRLEKAGDGWKIYDVNVLGAWLVQTYQSSFAQEVNASGIDGLIGKLVERNKQLAAKKVAG
ncbi:MAG: ABC transporter substrate-binding protein [Aquabacterium sp.]|uniref:MlaC/ttg2D family ABC transporter substrate-binding protein n=1 Tax=Aquabacterium sp. TaxID=1872578 RepID=UPI0025B8B988|nr:ABC transporter substrate-binding protein [Aquabacterium sp.]MBI3381201.1 ABC transporter substrate-binding protein [Aquabacterium sp.]